MDLIYTNANKEDIGVMKDYTLDLAFGSDENDFECKIAESQHCCKKGFFLYIENTEYGGIVDDIAVDVDEVTYSGRTWHGILNSKILCPDANADYLVVSGEANSVLASLINRMGLNSLFKASSDSSGVTITNYKMNRYIEGYDGIIKMLKAYGAKLKIKFSNGFVELSAKPIVDYSQDEQFDTDLIALAVKKRGNVLNHVICLGKGELAGREVIHVYADANGNISETQVFTGLAEVAGVYENANAEDSAELKQGGIDMLKAAWASDEIDFDFVDDAESYDIGDIVGAEEHITETDVTREITKKIVTIQNNTVTVSYPSSNSNSSNHKSVSSGGGGSSSSGDAVGVQSIVQTTTSTVDSGTNVITATLTDGTKTTFNIKNGSKGSKGDKGDKGDTGAQGNPTTVNGKSGASITLSASDVGAMGANPAFIELWPNTTAGHGGVIDFHYNGSTSDYTSRIIEYPSGTLLMNGVSLKSGTVTGALNGNATSATKATQDGNGKVIAKTYIPLTGSENITGGLFQKVNGNPYFGLNDGTTDWYLQALKSEGKVGLGPSWVNATKWDASGNMEVVGTIKEGGTPLNWYSQGTSIPSSADLNTYTTEGKYYAANGTIAASLVNCPTKANFKMYVFTRTTNKSINQLLLCDDAIYMRGANSSGTFGGWEKFSADSDRPSGTYNGNGSANSRQIDVGKGNTIAIWSSNGYAILTPKGGFYTQISSSTATMKATTSAEAFFENGILYLATTNSTFNTSGKIYNYQVL